MTYSAEVLTDTPIGYWRLGDSAAGTAAADSSGNARPGVTGAGGAKPTLGVAGLLTGDADTAATFNGQRIDVADDAAWDVAVLTVEAVVQMGTSSNPRAIIGRDDGASAKSWTFGTSSAGKVQLVILTNAGSFAFAESATSVHDNAVHHVAATFDGTTIQVYLDGAASGSATTTALVPGVNAQPLLIGTTGGVNIGTLDEVAFYGAALSAARMAVHAAAVNPPTPVLVLAPPMLALPRLAPAAPSFPVPLLVDAPPMIARPRIGAATALVPVNVSVGRFTVDPSQGWGFDLGALLALSALEPDDPPGSRVTQVSETYDDPTVIDGRPT